MMPFFGELLVRLIKEADMTITSFAKAVGAGQSSISQIASRKRTPPLDQLELWADTVGLKGSKRDEFLELAYLEHCPEPIRKEYIRQKAQIENIEKRLLKLEKNR